MKIEKKITAQDSENLSRYFADIRKYEGLTKEQEKELIIKIQSKDGDKRAMEKLINSNLKFVVSVAKHFQGQGVPLLDLISEGNAGLVEAAGRFDTTRDVKFFSYAVWWIRIRIFTNMDWNNRVIQLPANRTLLVTKVKRVLLALEQKLDRAPTLDELCEAMPECSEKELQEAIAYGGKTKSINDEIGGWNSNAGGADDDITIESRIAADDYKIDEIDRVESILKDLNRFLYHLSQIEYDVMVLSLGLNGESIIRNSDIAKSFSVKEKEVIKIKARAVKRLKKMKHVSSLQDYIN